MSGVRRLGADSEDRAAAYLADNGYTIVKRGHRSARGEIDILALHGDVLVVIEVKERLREGVAVEESVTPAKVKRLAGAAQHYMQSVGETEREVRYDLICFDSTGMRHHVDAFRP